MTNHSGYKEFLLSIHHSSHALQFVLELRGQHLMEGVVGHLYCRGVPEHYNRERNTQQISCLHLPVS